MPSGPQCCHSPFTLSNLIGRQITPHLARARSLHSGANPEFVEGELSWTESALRCTLAAAVSTMFPLLLCKHVLTRLTLWQDACKSRFHGGRGVFGVVRNQSKVPSVQNISGLAYCAKSGLLENTTRRRKSRLSSTIAWHMFHRSRGAFLFPS